MPLLIVTCGPAGVGKTTQMQNLINRDRRRFAAVLSVTTRQRRNADDGEWYRFVDHETAKGFDPNDVISDITYHDEQYVLLKSEIDKALATAPIAFMALVPDTILRLRTLGIPHAVINCKVGDEAGYDARLRKRGFDGDAISKAKAEAASFAYPPADPAWPQADAMLGSDVKDAETFTEIVRGFAGNLFPQSLQ